jgi:hypothetical protein
MPAPGSATDWLTTNRMNSEQFFATSRVVPKVEALACISSSMSGSAVRSSAESDVVLGAGAVRRSRVEQGTSCDRVLAFGGVASRARPVTAPTAVLFHRR